MHLIDRMWGEAVIQEPVLEELLHSQAVQRLDNISQFGLPFEYYPIKGFTRLEHSVGVMMLLRKLNASLGEQVAGLLHDVSHTAFSHLVDWAIGDRKTEDFQDKNHYTILSQPELTGILTRHKFSVEEIADYKPFTLLEQPSPKLCADRIDYAMREFADWANPYAARLCKDKFIHHQGEIVLSSYESARAFGHNYAKLHRMHWGGVEWMLRYQLFAETLRYALQEEVIAHNDFFNDEPYVLAKLKESDDWTIQHGLERLRRPLKFTTQEKGTPTYHLHKKFRWIDPSYLQNENVYTLTETDKEYAQLIQDERTRNADGIRITMLPH